MATPFIPSQKGVGVGPILGRSEFTTNTGPSSEVAKAPWSFGNYTAESSKASTSDDHKWWRRGKSARATAYRSQVGDVHAFWDKVHSGKAAVTDVQGVADFTSLRNELQRSHMSLQSADEHDAYRRPSSYRLNHSQKASEMQRQARVDHATSRIAAQQNRSRATGTSVQDALREDL